MAMVVRRSFFYFSGFFVAVLLSVSSVYAQNEWTYDAYTKAMKDSGRKVNISEKTFNAVQSRKKKAVEVMKKYLKQKLGKVNDDVVKAFSELPREYYYYNYKGNYSFAGSVYEIPSKPWAVGYGSAISDFVAQAYMTQLASPDAEDVALEIGTGSGYQISALSRIVKEAYSIEIIKPLGNKVAKIFAPLAYDNVHTKVGDGYYGWPEVEGGFDIIMVTCSAQFVPPPLLEQLKPGGKLIIPIGSPYKHNQSLYIYTKDAKGKVHSKKDMGIYFIPMTGQMQKGK